MVVSEEIRAAGLRFCLDKDGNCDDQAALGRLLQEVQARHADSPLLRRVRQAYDARRRLSAGQILQLAELCAGPAPSPPRPASPPRPVAPPVPAFVSAPEPSVVPEPPKPGFDYVLRRLIGVLFLTPFVLVIPAVGLLVHLGQLAFKPNQTLRRSRFRLREALAECARFAFYEDFGRTHLAALAASALLYAALGAWMLWFPAQAVLTGR